MLGSLSKRQKGVAMDQNNFREGLKVLQDFYGKNISEVATKVWWQKLQWLDNRDFHSAIEGVTAHERQMPTPGVFLKYADESRTRRSANESAKERDIAGEVFDPSEQSRGIAKDCCEGMDIIMRLRPGMDKQAYIAAFAKTMHAKYPRAGFDKLELEAREELRRLERIEAQKKEKVPA